VPGGFAAGLSVAATVTGGLFLRVSKSLKISLSRLPEKKH